MFSHGKRMVAGGKNVRFRPFRLFLDGLYFYAHRFSPRRRPLCKLAGRGFQTGYKMRPRRGAKASPGGEAGSPLGLTDEVEATDYHHRLVQNCNLRPHPVRLEPDHLPLQGKAFLCPGGLLRRFLPLKYCRTAGGACRRPYSASPEDIQKFGSLHPLSHGSAVTAPPT